MWSQFSIFRVQLNWPPMSHGVPAPMLEELAREATLADVSILVDGNDAELHVHGNGAEVHDNGTELHGNGAVLKRVEMPQVREVYVSLNVYFWYWLPWKLVMLAFFTRIWKRFQPRRCRCMRARR